MGSWNPTFRKERETWGTLFRGAGRRRRATRLVEGTSGGILALLDSQHVGYEVTVTYE